VGNRTGDQIDDLAITGTYDSMNRQATRVGGGLVAFEGTVSEPATVTVQGTPATVDATNRFVAAAAVSSPTTTVSLTATDSSGNSRTQEYEVDAVGSSSAFVFDANGNLAAQGSKTYEWDAADRLVRVLDGGAEVARFSYDGFGRRVQKIVGGVTRTYIYAAEDIIEERLPSSAVRHVQGPGIDTPLATVDAQGAVSYYLADHLGSVVQQTNGSGDITLTRRYDPFGKLLQGESEGGYAFTGREWDAETGLYYYRARFYEPVSGRFISADPIGFGSGVNLYAYVVNNPLVFIDPTGNSGLLAVLSAAGGLAALDGPLPVGDILALGLIATYAIDELIVKPQLSKGGELEDDNLRWDKFKEEYDGVKSDKESKKQKFPREDRPEDTLDDLEKTRDGFRKGGRDQIDSTDKTKQKLPKRGPCEQ
jgi:RHS repeat-associated protein